VAIYHAEPHDSTSKVVDGGALNNTACLALCSADAEVARQGKQKHPGADVEELAGHG
jgi:hypothetical protein